MGLLIVTSRQRLTGLAAAERISVQHVDINALKPKDGAALLTSLGVTGGQDEKEQAAREMGGHAFGLVLLGHYLVRVTGDPDITKRDQARLFDANVAGSEKAKAVLRAYEDWFGEAAAETAMLNLLGLFDRPVPMAALRALVEEPVIAGLTDRFAGAKATPITVPLGRLQELRLITRPDAETVDGHPLVREYFGPALREESPKVWKQANSRLFDYFRGIPDQDQPDSAADLMPLYQSLHHGVAAGRAYEPLDHVYYRRIGRSGKSFGVNMRGLYSTDLAAVAAFFPDGWRMPLQDLPKSDQSYLLNVVGFRLRALGRFEEARVALERGVALDVELGDHENAAIESNNLGELLRDHGELQAAFEKAKDSLHIIDDMVNEADRFIYKTHLAHLLAMQGKVNEACLSGYHPHPLYVVCTHFPE